MNRLQWFQDARDAWLRSQERMTVADYQPYFDSFCPDPGCAEEWADAAVRAGMKYVVLTTKHHDGFCLFDSKLTEYKSTNTPARRDLIREYVDALRSRGLRVGFYYSLLDWHHPDYPAWHDRQHPLRDDEASKERDRRADWNRYVAYYHGQVEELLTHYGKIDLLVFDFSYWDMTENRWQAEKLVKRIRELQPDVLMNDRFGAEPIKQVPRPAWAGDYDQTEMDIPREGVVDAAGQPIPWECWVTLNNNWGYDPLDTTFKPAVDLIHALVNCVSKGGNFTLNLSPDGRGHLDARALAILDEVGGWLRKNGESVYGCGPAGLPKPEWGRLTRRGDVLYAHILEPGFGHYNLPGLRGHLKNARLVADGTEVILCDYWNPGIQTFDSPEDQFFNLRRPEAWTWPVPDRRDTVVRFERASGTEREAALAKADETFRRLTTPRDRNLL